ncbi:uncharacterized protein TNCV_319301 [Trichonephila clavipes]|nr:uncharacterized protein TNCV_319301 [Trichonephila clavipes]
MGLSQADAARRLNVFRSVVQRLWDQYQFEILCPEGLFQADHELNTCRRPFHSSFGTKEKNHYCAAARCRPLSSIRKKIFPLLIAKSSSQCRSVARRPVACVFFNGRHKMKPLMLGKRTCFSGRSQWASVLKNRRVQIYNGE